MTNDDIRRIASDAAREIMCSETRTGQLKSDAEEIATAVLDRLHANGVCPNGMDAETVKALKEVLPDLKEFVNLYRGGKASIRAGIFAVLGVGTAAVFVIGAYEKIKQMFGKP